MRSPSSDTATLQVAATIPVGPDPVDMAFSLDGGTLYVANHGTAAAAISAVDLDALTIRATFALPDLPKAIAAGLAGRLYVSTGTASSLGAIYQLDGTTGEVKTPFNGSNHINDLLQVTPDGGTLFAADTGLSPCSLDGYDVSMAAPLFRKENFGAGTNARQLVVSHHGQYVCLPGVSNTPGGGYATYLFSTVDITAH